MFKIKLRYLPPSIDYGHGGKLVSLIKNEPIYSISKLNYDHSFVFLFL